MKKIEKEFWKIQENEAGVKKQQVQPRTETRPDRSTCMTGGGDIRIFRKYQHLGAVGVRL